MKTPSAFLLGLVGLVGLLLCGPSSAGPTGIAQLPLLNITGTGNVRPNLMLLYDNSGSMAWSFIPDYVGNSNGTCRDGATLADAQRACIPGDPPYNSPDFNKQYYNPAIRYTPAVRADGTSYPSQTRSATTNWTAVSIDGFGVTMTDIFGGSASGTTINLATRFPDLAWCSDPNDNSTCTAYNTASYVYPDATYNGVNYDRNGNMTQPLVVGSNPYYYTIGVAEYCSDAALTKCVTTALNAAAPSGYAFPAKVRWCNSANLTSCQAKYTDTAYFYPRFSNPSISGVAAYGTITVGASRTSSTLTINSVTINDPAGALVVTNNAATAQNGTNTSDRQAAEATDLAYQIVVKTGLRRTYTACVQDPSSASSTVNAAVRACSYYGITLANANVVAVIPLNCPSGSTSKSIGVCKMVADASQNGWTMSVSANTVVTQAATRTRPAQTDTIPVSTSPLGAGAQLFVRTDIIPAITSYPKAAARIDCAAGSCSYDEEMTNFANWYSYYRTRNQMMKTAVGQAFQALNSNYNVGIVSLAAAASNGTMTTPTQFTGSARTNWYSTLYGMTVGGATPMRVALHAVGKMYADASQNVVQYPCQQNFTLITTDGYWNGNPATGVANNDNVANPDRFCTQATGCVDTRSQNPASLADVGLYWYNGGSATGTASLRPDLEDMTKQGVVPGGATDNTHLHMNTFALGLGVDGIMKFEPNYDTAADPANDFYKLTTGATGCPWNGGGTYVWPDPQTGNSLGSASIQARVDDLWHTAINGHGKYFSAADPASVVTSLSTVLSNIQVRTGAASAAATSTPNISQQDNDIFSATFTTVRWYGEITDRKIDPLSGIVGDAITWSTSNTLGSLTALDNKGNDGRTVYMLDTVTGNFKPFLFAGMTATEQAWFGNKCSQLSQCNSLSAADQAIVNNGDTIVDWLRGQQTYADDARLRAYSKTQTGSALPIVLGDVASAKPAYQRDPRKGYTFDDYGSFKATNAVRKPTVFVAANDGMLHAFDASNGVELWAYAPRITMKKLYLQASTTYATNHQFTTDGSPEIADVEIGGKWRSVLVAGLNGGGRGYYALDVTDPANPAPLWELCADAAVCSGNNLLPSLGLSFGNPQFGTWKDGGGAVHWVVFLTSGYNNIPGTDNVSTGDGRGYLYVVDVATGQVLSSTSTAAGDTSNPSGFARITAVTANPNSDPLVTAVYGGDNLGNMWRFDFSQPGAAPAPVLMGGAGSNQPITSRPEVTLCAVTTTDAQQNTTTTAQKYVVFGTGRMLDLPDLTNTAQQSVYVLKDTGVGIAAGDWRKSARMADRQFTKNVKTGTYSIAGDTVNLSTQAGWYFDFDQNPGERVNLDPKVVSGALNVVTNIPSSSSACQVGGVSNVYQLNVCTGVPVASDGLAGRSLSTTSAAVGFIIVRLPSGALKMITTTADGGTITTGVAPGKLIAPHRAGWREVHE